MAALTLARTYLSSDEEDFEDLGRNADLYTIYRIKLLLVSVLS